MLQSDSQEYTEYKHIAMVCLKSCIVVPKWLIHLGFFLILAFLRDLLKKVYRGTIMAKSTTCICALYPSIFYFLKLLLLLLLNLFTFITFYKSIFLLLAF